MKKILAISALALVALGTSQALAATTHHHAAPKTLIVAMHDPGCHWFLVHGKFTNHATVGGAVRIIDRDEATLKVVSRRGTQLIPVGKSLVIRRGYYVVMMVGQAHDDNYLKLTVR